MWWKARDSNRRPRHADAMDLDRKPRRRQALGLPDQRKNGRAAGREPAVIESGNAQPQRRLKSASGCYSVGLDCFRFLFYCIHMGVCLVLARFLSITFQRFALRQGDSCFALSLSNRRVH
jgi:hypothetical protein